MAAVSVTCNKISVVVADLLANGESTARQVARRLGYDDARVVTGPLVQARHDGLVLSRRPPDGGPVRWSVPGKAGAPRTAMADRIDLERARLLAQLRAERDLPVPRARHAVAVDVDWICLLLDRVGFRGDDPATWAGMEPELAAACGSLEALVAAYAARA